MKGFGFSLSPDTSLRKDNEGCFLVLRVPVRMLRLNESLYRLLVYIRDGGEISAFIEQNPSIDMNQLLLMLLSLVSRGYLKLDRIAEIQEFPSISVIIPVKDQPQNLIACLESLNSLEYPKDKLEIIVVDDGSREDISKAVSLSGIRIIRHEESKGPATSRNEGAEHAGGELLAFLDSDCIAGKNWLRELVPFFRISTVGAVGGYVDGYYKNSFLDRYELVASSLNMGTRLLIEGGTESTFYVPTANMLVKREVFMSTNGFKNGMYIGEDVDFCWRMRNLGHSLLYVPVGSISHKHRNHLGGMLKRRAEYGMSEAALYRTHHEKKKSFTVSLLSGLSFLALTLAIMLMNPYPLIAIPLLFIIDLLRRSREAGKVKIKLSFRETAYSTFRSYLSFFYFTFFHLMRYFLVLFVGFGFLWHPLWIFGGLIMVYPSLVDYFVKKPTINYPVFLIFYLMEHLVYQAGVFWGCVRLGYFGSYGLSFRKS